MRNAARGFQFVGGSGRKGGAQSIQQVSDSQRRIGYSGIVAQGLSDASEDARSF